MCAAPGSKTAQLIEMIHADEGNVPPGNLYKIGLKEMKVMQMFIFNFYFRGFCNS